MDEVSYLSEALGVCQVRVYMSPPLAARDEVMVYRMQVRGSINHRRVTAVNKELSITRTHFQMIQGGKEGIKN